MPDGMFPTPAPAASQIADTTGSKMTQQVHQLLISPVGHQRKNEEGQRFFLRRSQIYLCFRSPSNASLERDYLSIEQI